MLWIPWIRPWPWTDVLFFWCDTMGTSVRFVMHVLRHGLVFPSMMEQQEGKYHDRCSRLLRCTYVSTSKQKRMYVRGRQWTALYTLQACGRPLKTPASEEIAARHHRMLYEWILVPISPRSTTMLVASCEQTIHCCVDQLQGVLDGILVLPRSSLRMNLSPSRYHHRKRKR